MCVCELHLQVLIMRDVNLVNWFIALTYPDCTILPFTDHVHDTLSNTRYPVVMQNSNQCFISCLKLMSHNMKGGTASVV
jgi:hypothetical protein